MLNAMLLWGGVTHIMQVKASNYCNVECNSVWTVLITQAYALSCVVLTNICIHITTPTLHG